MKTISQDKTPPDLMKMAAEPFENTFVNRTKHSFKYIIFPSNAKVAGVKPLHKKTEDESCISNF